MKRFISYSLPCLIIATFAVSVNQTWAERIFYDSFETPVNPGGGTDPTGWSAPGHPNYFRVASESGSSWSTPYGEQAITTYSNGVATKTLAFLDTEPGVYTLSFNISSNATIGEYKAELWIKHPFFGDVLVGSTEGDTDGSKDMSFADSIVWTLDPFYAGAELEVRLGQDPNRSNWRHTPVWDNVALDFIADNDVSPPTLVEITDDRVGGSVAPGSPVTYTVTFSEDIDASTVSVADFYNQAGATVTVDSVSETAPTSGVFTVQVTPTGGGTLRLGINPSALIEDIEGNMLDTTGSILDITDNTTIFVEGTLPILAPIDITDDRNGTPVALNSPVIYTLNFSKDMDAATVQAADFSNAGSAAVTIGAITETSPTSGVFTVQFTPTSGGTLKFRVNSSADLKDTAANALDTSSAIEDDTTITVDATAPTLASADIIDADNLGNPLTTNTTVQYTLIFSEDIDASSVTAADFGNAGSSTITIGDIAEPSAGVFTVDITPTSVGTLQLRVNASAIIMDALGNNLNTSSAITDDTIITVNAAPSNPYDSWAGGASFADDTNEDGVSNGMAWALGAADVNANAADLLPTYDYSTDPNYIICTFRRADEANDHSDTTMVVQYGTTLGSSSWNNAVHDNDNVIITVTDNHYSTTPGVDRVVVKLKRSSLSADGKLFARLSLEQAPEDLLLAE
ncbi:MAG: hypothetical protein AB8F34_04330 [Akkermansiaceae bacterium]